jgi:cytochrome c-type biogenesis protein
LGTSVAPLLLLLAFVTATGRPENGFMLALAFGIGRGIPFLIIGVLAGIAVRLTRLTQWRRTLQVVSGCALLLLSGYYTQTFLALR